MQVSAFGGDAPIIIINRLLKCQNFIRYNANDLIGQTATSSALNIPSMLIGYPYSYRLVSTVNYSSNCLQTLLVILSLTFYLSLFLPRSALLIYTDIFIIYFGHYNRIREALEQDKKPSQQDKIRSITYILSHSISYVIF